jgi:RimJ/RimL family protein N-acetyltransferase
MVPSLDSLRLSVIECRQTGRIFVDQPDQPQCVIVWHPTEIGFVYGKAGPDELIDDVHDLLFNRLYKDNGFIAVVPGSQAWDKNLSAMPDCNLLQTRISYMFHPEKFEPNRNWTSRLLPNVRVARLDATLRDQMIAEFYFDDFNQSWHTDDFLANGFGFCLMIENTIASVCLTYAACTSSKEVEITVCTGEAFRSKGWGTLVVTAFIDYCLANGLTPVWSNSVNNQASSALGEKMGFEPKAPYPLYGKV